MAKTRIHLSDDEIERFVEAHEGWARVDDALVKTFVFGDYSASIGFVVRVGFAAERRDHHPDMTVGWRKVVVSWSTHDAGGITALDTELAELVDRLRTS